MLLRTRAAVSGNQPKNVRAVEDKPRGKPHVMKIKEHPVQEERMRRGYTVSYLDAAVPTTPTLCRPIITGLWKVAQTRRAYGNR